MRNHQESLKRVVQTILGVFDDDREAATRICLSLAQELSSHSAVKPDFNSERYQELIQVKQGQAISPEAAAGCIMDPYRTIRYIQAIHEAIINRAEQSDETIHILYAGCGPYGALVLPLLTLFNSTQIQVSFSDRNPDSINSLNSLIAHYGLASYVKILHLGDAVDIPLSEEADILVIENLRQGLEMEPQVALTRALAPKLKQGGVLIPESVSIEALVLDTPSYFDSPKTLNLNAPKVRLGKLMELSLETLGAFNQALIKQEDRTEVYSTDPLKIPEHTLPETAELVLQTKIVLWKDIGIAEGQSGLTMPKLMRDFRDPSPSDSVVFEYHLADWPRWNAHIEYSDPLRKFQATMSIS